MDILWIDDDFESFQYDFELAENEFNKLDYTVIKAETPTRGIDSIKEKYAKKEQYSFILLDIMMGNFNEIMIDGKTHNTNYGYDAGKIIYVYYLIKQHVTKNIPIFIYTNIEEDPVFDEWVRKEKIDNAKLRYVKKSEGYEKLVKTILEYNGTN